MTGTATDAPLVCVLTPVFNGERHLADCIRSVLAQTYPNLEYTIVNNCSTDRTLEIAQSFAQQDSRIRIHNNLEFLGVVENHNNAFSLIPDRAPYCKIVGADDWLFPHCIAELVKVAEKYPTVGMVSSNVLIGARVGEDGLPFSGTFTEGTASFTKGRDICRMYFLDDVKVFGGPSNSLLRASVVKARSPFYKVGNYDGDTEAYIDMLQEHDFGFVHQVLGFKRRGADSRTTSYLQRVNSHIAADLEFVVKYGSVYLTEDERRACLQRATKRYYKFLAESVIEMRGKELWNYHRDRMRRLGVGIDYFKVARHVLYRLMDMALNPKRTVEGAVRRLRNRAPTAPN